jgi:hypothetical protein
MKKKTDLNEYLAQLKDKQKEKEDKPVIFDWCQKCEAATRSIEDRCVVCNNIKYY